MSLLRLVVAWLVMAALPLQGIAAASMLFCGPATHSTVTQHPGHDHAGHDHASHDHASHDHASHGHGGGSDLGAAHAEGTPDQQTAAGQGGAAQVDDGHGCPVCSSCCNLVAFSVTPTLALDGDSPSARPHHGPSRVLTRDSPAPDKPPRA